MIHKFDGYFEALSPIHQGGDEKTGSSPVLNTITIFNVEANDFFRIPIISGNSIKNVIRRRIMYDFLQLIDVNPDEMENTKLQQVLMGGGNLESVSDEKDSGVIDLELRRKIKRLFIPLSIYGVSLKNQMIEGKIKCGIAFPICREYSIYLPDKYKELEQANLPVRTFTDTSFFTRRDDVRAEREKDEQAIQMKVDYEVILPGARLYHWWVLEHPTEVELSCFGRMIELFREMPFIGGKSSSGIGNINIHYYQLIPTSEEYMKFVSDNRNEIIELYNNLDKVVK